MDHILTLRLREGIGDAGHQSGHFRCEQMRNCIPLVDPRALLQASPFGLSGDANDEEKTPCDVANRVFPLLVGQRPTALCAIVEVALRGDQTAFATSVTRPRKTYP